MGFTDISGQKVDDPDTKGPPLYMSVGHTGLVQVRIGVCRYDGVYACIRALSVSILCRFIILHLYILPNVFLTLHFAGSRESGGFLPAVSRLELQQNRLGS